MTQCPVCDYENLAGVLICEECHNDLYETLLELVTTKQLDKGMREQLGDISPSSNPLVLYIRHNEEPLAIPRQADLMIGRSDDRNRYEIPDVDLEPYGAGSEGVSREHFVLDAHTNPPTIIDMGSYNGTFVNGQRLSPNQPYPLHSGDEIRLGHMVTRLYYK